jgi:energy-coupling factor transporter ATP-binding protein EcfA2
MKVKSIHIQNFKQFDHLELSFENHLLGEISDRFLILGDNGSGKTTLLQAIALPLALATGKITQIPEFDWTGFLPGRYWRRGAPHIELVISFTPEELEATRAIAQLWYDAQPQEFRHDRPFTIPSDNPEVTLTLNGDHWRAGNTPAERAQFQGRSYAQRLIQKGNPTIRSHFQDLPGIFWFDQFRNLGSNPTPDSTRDNPYPRNSSTSFEIGVSRLRQYLVDWHRRSKPGDPKSYLTQLETLYRQVFPDRRFIGTEILPSFDSPTEDNTFFLLEDAQHHQYDIAEMSAGEQAVFPILYEFVRQQIAHSIVLIDEIDLNLHPPAAQFLMKQLPRIAPTCQFIVTTHSEAATAVVSTSETHRLAGGALCL